MSGTDPLTYHGWATALAKHYGSRWGLCTPDDLYQVAMIGLLELWRTKPEADEPLCMTRMRHAVLGEIRKAAAAKRSATVVPMDEAPPLSTPDDMLHQLTGKNEGQQLLRLIEELHPKEQAAVKAHMSGRPADRQQLKQARERLRKWLVDPRRGEMAFWTTAPQRWNPHPAIHEDRNCPRLRRATVAIRLPASLAKGRPRCQICCKANEATA